MKKITCYSCGKNTPEAFIVPGPKHEETVELVDRCYSCHEALLRLWLRDQGYDLSTEGIGSFLEVLSLLTSAWAKASEFGTGEGWHFVIERGTFRFF